MSFRRHGANHANAHTDKSPKRNHQKNNRKVPPPVPSGFVPTALTAAFQNPAIASAIRQFVFETMQKSIAGLRREFAMLSRTPDTMARVPLNGSTAHKFRYKDILCLEKTRVVLTFLPHAGDFVHANWVKSDVITNAFICCQAPLEHTSGDFWRLVWQERVQHVFMLCRCEETGKSKCAQYWPLLQGDVRYFYDVLMVRNEGVTEIDADIVTTVFNITCHNETRRVEHRAWRSWPDKSVPKNPVPAFKLLHIARSSKNPVVVHCSAGIGRTGTLVALELLQRTLMHAQEPNMSKIVLEIRCQRAQAVQTEDQYVFIHHVLLSKLAFHGLMAQQDYKIFHDAYDAYIRSIGGIPPMQPALPPTMTPPLIARQPSPKSRRQGRKNGHSRNPVLSPRQEEHKQMPSSSSGNEPSQRHASPHRKKQQQQHQQQHSARQVRRDRSTRRRKSRKKHATPSTDATPVDGGGGGGGGQGQQMWPSAEHVKKEPDQHAVFDPPSVRPVPPSPMPVRDQEEVRGQSERQVRDQNRKSEDEPAVPAAPSAETARKPDAPVSVFLQPNMNIMHQEPKEYCAWNSPPQPQRHEGERGGQGQGKSNPQSQYFPARPGAVHSDPDDYFGVPKKQ